MISSDLLREVDREWDRQFAAKLLAAVDQAREAGLDDASTTDLIAAYLQRARTGLSDLHVNVRRFVDLVEFGRTPASLSEH